MSRAAQRLRRVWRALPGQVPLATMVAAVVLVAISAWDLTRPAVPPPFDDRGAIPMEAAELAAMNGGRVPTWGQVEKYYALSEDQLERSIRSTLTEGGEGRERLPLPTYRGQQIPAGARVLIWPRLETAPTY